MAIVDIYSKRLKRENGEVSDVFQYENFPEKLKVQIIQIFEDAYLAEYAGDFKFTLAENTFKEMVEILRKEYGEFALYSDQAHLNNYYKHYRPWQYELFNYFLSEKFVLHCLDVVELLCLDLPLHLNKNNLSFKVDFRNVIREVNERFKENGFGYQYEEGKIIRVDSKFIHQEAVKPVLNLLHSPEYEGANEEFIKAFDHYKVGENEAAIVECLKAFESTMKIICVKQGWSYSPNDTASKLIKICLDNQLVPSFWDAQLNALRGLLESSMPTVRNRNAAHGQGDELRDAPNYLVSYMLHMTASSILFLINAEKSLSH